jgi:hypothetical protein
MGASEQFLFGSNYGRMREYHNNHHQIFRQSLRELLRNAPHALFCPYAQQSVTTLR